MSIYDFFEFSARKYAERIFLKTIDKSLSYSEAIKSVNQLSYYLKTKHNIRENDYVALLLPNIVEFPLIALALNQLGAHSVFLNNQSSSKEINSIINAVDKDMHVISDQKLEINTIDPMDFVYKEELQENKENGTFICFTTGTTGIPKGVVFTSENLIDNVIALSNDAQLLNNMKQLLLLPLYHMYCFMANILAGIHLGHCIYISSNETMSQVIKNEKIELFIGVPTFFTKLLMMGDLKDFFSSCKIMINGAAALPDDQVQKFKKEIPQLKYLYFYGSTDSGGAISILTDNDYDQHKKSLGKALNNVDVKILDLDMNEYVQEKIGEILVKRKYMPTTYYNVDKGKYFYKGYFRTGDLGILKNNFLYYMGRTDDMFKVNGITIYASEIEHLFSENDNVKDIAIIPKKTIMGDQITAYVVTRNLESVEKFAESIPKYKRPTEYIVEDSIPRNHMGKIDRKLLFKKLNEAKNRIGN